MACEAIDCFNNRCSTSGRPKRPRTDWSLTPWSGVGLEGSYDYTADKEKSDRCGQCSYSYENRRKGVGHLRSYDGAVARRRGNAAK